MQRHYVVDPASVPWKRSSSEGVSFECQVLLSGEGSDELLAGYGKYPRALINWRGEQKLTADNAEMKSLDVSLKLQGSSMLQPEREYPGEATVVMQTVWPNLIIQQQSNTLAMRQIQCVSPEEFELHWTFFGYADDDAQLRQLRLQQANLTVGRGRRSDALHLLDRSRCERYHDRMKGEFQKARELLQT